MRPPPLEELRPVEAADGSEPEPADMAELPPDQDMSWCPVASDADRASSFT